MADITRLFNFVDHTVIDPEQVDAEFDQILATLNNLDPSNVGTALASLMAETGDYCFSGRGSKTGWLLCDGAAVSRLTNAALFGLIGTRHGVGDGSTTFNLPDFRGRFPVGAGTHADVATLASADLVAVGSRTPRHSHTIAHTHTGPSHTHPTPSVGVLATGTTAAANPATYTLGTAGGGGAGTSIGHVHDVATSGVTAASNTSAGGTGATSGASATNSGDAVTPYQTVNVFIKT